MTTSMEHVRFTPGEPGDRVIDVAKENGVSLVSILSSREASTVGS